MYVYIWSCAYSVVLGFLVYLHLIQITALEDRVGVETEATAFTDQFWQSQQIIINALDNIQVNKMKE